METSYQVNHTLMVQGIPSGHRMGLVDLHFKCSTASLTQQGLVGIWQKWLGTWVRWWHSQIKVNPTQDYDQMEHTVSLSTSTHLSSRSFTLTRTSLLSFALRSLSRTLIPSDWTWKAKVGHLFLHSTCVYANDVTVTVAYLEFRS